LGLPDLERIEPLTPDDGEPAFEEAWQAQVLAIAFALSERNAFTPGQWSQALGAELRKRALKGDPDTRETYYLAALSALENLVGRTGFISREALDYRTEQWRQAHLHTPHGQPVDLKNSAARR
jgi:nitrile hydratase accessory protein